MNYYKQNGKEPPMEKMIAVCGIECHQCPAFLATRENDDLKRKEVAEMWSKDFKAEIKPEDINCEGCTSGKERLFSHCHVCEIRKCGREKQLQNCAYCADYSCSKLNGLFQMIPQGKVVLDEIRKGLS
jgi:hypothetical protein